MAHPRSGPVTAQALAAQVAAEIADGVAAAAAAGRRYVLGCPSGRTPRPVYAALAAQVGERHLPLAHVVIAMLDEYVVRAPDGTFARVDPAAPHSCARFGREEVVGALNAAAPASPLPAEAMLVPDPAAPGDYDALLDSLGGIDLLLLASGASDGHVAFNPPGTPRDAPCRVVELAESTRVDNTHTFPSFADLAEVPTHGVTMGTATMVRTARRTVMLVTGAAKREAARRLLAARAYDPQWPATIVTECRAGSVLVDDDAAGRP